MVLLLHLPLQNAGAGGFVLSSDLQDMRRVDPVVLAAAHDMIVVDSVFIDGDVAVRCTVYLAEVVARHDQGRFRLSGQCERGFVRAVRGER